MVGLLLTLALPFSKIEFGFINAQQLPSTSESRQVFNAMEHDFDGDAVKPIDSLLLLKSDGTSKGQGAALKAYAERLGATEGATSARITGIEGGTARGSVTFDGNPISTHARDLVNRIKEVPAPPDAQAYIGGESAIYDDTLDALGETPPWMLLYIAVMTYILLLL